MTSSSSDQPDTAGTDAGEILNLRLYVANRSPNSLRAMANLEAICRECLKEGTYRLEVVDILADPLRAVRDKILVTPTLAKLSIPPVLILGDLSERDRVLAVLGLRGRVG
jgi:circadian clock protein KaiB